jgi:oligoendopeptidase F
MDTSIIPERKDIPEEFTWDLRDIFPDDDAWGQELEKLGAMGDAVTAFAGTLGERPGRLLDWLKLMDEINVRLEKLVGYANCKSDQDTGNSFYQDMRSKAIACAVNLSGLSAFSTPEILAIPDEVLDRFYLECPALEEYRRSLTSTRRMRAHTLSAEEERLLEEHNQHFQNTSTAEILLTSYYEPAARQKEHFVRAVDILQDLQQRTLGSDRPNMQRLVKALKAQHFEYGAIDGQRGWYAVKRE